MAECAVCREPALPGQSHCSRHADDEAGAVKTQMVRLDELGMPMPTPPSGSGPVVAPDEADAQKTAMIRVFAPVPTDPVVPPIAAPLENADAQKTAMIRVAAPESTDPAMPPVAMPTEADAQKTAMIRLPSPATTDPATALVSPLDALGVAPETLAAVSEDLVSTSTARVAAAPLPVAAPVSEDFVPTSMIRVASPVPAEDLVATSMTRVPAPPPVAPLARPPSADDLPGSTAPAVAKVAAPNPAPRKGSALGRVLGGRFEVKTHLGSGGFGATFVAWDQRLKRECVIKMLRPLSSDPSPFEIELRKRFSNEALTLAHLIHPNITQVFDHGEEADGANWIAMEYVRGRQLSDIGREEKQLDCQRVARLGSHIASALAFAHARGIVHRDLKPDNVLVVENQTGGEQAKVLDFGIARITDPQALGLDQNQAQLTNIGAFLGTPAFMSPEQAEGAPVGPASDVYSLGVVLYLLVTGRLPGVVPSAWSPLTTIAYVHSPFETVRSIRPSCPPLLAETIERMLIKEPHKRTLSAAQVQTELAALAPTTYQPGGAMKPLAQKRSVLPMITAGAVVVALGAVLALFLTRKELEAKPAPQVIVTAPAPAGPDPRVAAREAAVNDVLRRARGGAPSAVIDPAADELAKDGADARLVLAKALAHFAEKDFDGAVPLFESAATSTKDAALVKEAMEQKALAESAQAAAHAARPKPDVEPAKAKAKPKGEERPDY